jgi:hypothetical protein
MQLPLQDEKVKAPVSIDSQPNEELAQLQAEVQRLKQVI